MKKTVIPALKIILPLLLIAWLLSRLEEDQVRQLRERPLDWPLMAIAFVAFFLAVCLSFVRWHGLVRALGIPFRLRDAFRLGFLGYLFNFVSVGNVGGDLFKAVFIAREQPGRRTLAVATVFVDRVAGLYGLIVAATLAIALLGLPVETTETVALRRLVYLAAGGGALAIAILMVPGFTTSPLEEWVTSLPKVGPLLEQGVTAVRMYRRQPVALLVAGILSLTNHVLMTLSISLLARGMFSSPPTFQEHLIIVPLSNLVGALPFTPAGLGTFEVAMESLYRVIPAGTIDASAVTVALAFRLVTIGIAAVGMGVYWWSRRELAPVLETVAPPESSAARPVGRASEPSSSP